MLHATLKKEGACALNILSARNLLRFLDGRHEIVDMREKRSDQVESAIICAEKIEGRRSSACLRFSKKLSAGLAIKLGQKTGSTKMNDRRRQHCIERTVRNLEMVRCPACMQSRT